MTEGEGCAAGGKGEGPRAGHSHGSGKYVVALARAITESNEHLWAIAEYVDWLAWSGESDESDEGSEEWDSGDKQVVRESDQNIVNRE